VVLFPEAKPPILLESSLHFVSSVGGLTEVPR